MVSPRLACKRRRERGTSTLELVLVMPVLILIVFGGMELARAWFTLNLVTTAAREGARASSVTSGFSAGPGLNRIDALLVAANLRTDATFSVICSPPCSPAANSQVTATVTVPFRTLFPVLLGPAGLGSQINLSQTAIMRFEGP